MKQQYLLSPLLLLLFLAGTAFSTATPKSIESTSAASVVAPTTASIAFPTDGQGLYESCPLRSVASCLSHLDQMAAVGFKLVMNYAGLRGHASDLLTYANHARSVGMRVIWSLQDLRIWNGSDFSAVYPELTADSGCAHTDDVCLTTYVVNLVKGLPGTWGYYVGDEVNPSLHNLLKVHTDLIHQLDPNHPRLFVDGVSHWTPVSIAKGNSVFHDVSDIVESNYYPIGYYSGNSISDVATYAKGIQAYANHYSLQSAMGLQAVSWAEYYPPARCSPFPSCAPFPTAQQMRSMRDLALSNMHPRLLLWYSYFDVLRSDNPIKNWVDLAYAANG